jgi:hypothetical protein
MMDDDPEAENSATLGSRERVINPIAIKTPRSKLHVPEADRINIEAYRHS